MSHICPIFHYSDFMARGSLRLKRQPDYWELPNGSARSPNDDMNHQKYTHVIHPATPVFAGVPDDPDQKTSTDTGGHQRTPETRSTVTKVTNGRTVPASRTRRRRSSIRTTCGDPDRRTGHRRAGRIGGPHGRIATRLCDAAVGPKSGGCVRWVSVSSFLSSVPREGPAGRAHDRRSWADCEPSSTDTEVTMVPQNLESTWIRSM